MRMLLIYVNVIWFQIYHLLFLLHLLINFCSHIYSLLFSLLLLTNHPLINSLNRHQNKKILFNVQRPMSKRHKFHVNDKKSSVDLSTELFLQKYIFKNSKTNTTFFHLFLNHMESVQILFLIQHTVSFFS